MAAPAPQEEGHTYPPDPERQAEVVALDEHLQRSAEEVSSFARLVTEVGEVDVPPQVLAMLVAAVHDMAKGLAVDVVPRQPLLSTQQAADMLRISRPTLVRLLDAGEIPFERPGRRRKIRLADLIEYRRRTRSTDVFLDRLVAEQEEKGLYELDAEQGWEQALKEVRQRRRGKAG